MGTGRCATSVASRNMQRLMGYLRTLRQYLASPKGRRDTLDALRAGAFFLLITAIVLIILSIVR